MKKKIIIVSVIVLAISLWCVHKYTQRAATKNADAIIVQASVVKQSSLAQEVHAIGTLTATSSEITSEVAGHVQNIYFRDGTFVKSGALLIQLDDAIAKAQFDTAKAKLDYTEKNFKRLTSLSKKGFLALNDIDKAEADLKEKRADAQEKEVLWQKRQLKAPFDGMVGKSSVNKGDYVDAGNHLVTLTDTKHLRIEFNIPEKNLALLKLGQDVKISTAAYPGKTFNGKVAFISPTINAENRSISIYADVPNDDNKLTSGMFVDVTESLESENNVLMIPARSLIPVLDGEQVFKIVEGKAVAVTVKIGKRSEDSVQVISGLSPGDIVITDGQLKVKTGVPVKLKT